MTTHLSQTIDITTHMAKYDASVKEVLADKQILARILKYTLDDGSWFVLRPSGTEPKAKVYIGVIADVIDAADAQVAKIKEDVLARVNEIIA